MCSVVVNLTKIKLLFFHMPGQHVNYLFGWWALGFDCPTGTFVMHTSTCSTTAAVRRRCRLVGGKEAMSVAAEVGLAVPLGMSACTSFPATTCTRLRRGAAARLPPRTEEHQLIAGTSTNYDEVRTTHLTSKPPCPSKSLTGSGYRSLTIVTLCKTILPIFISKW